MKNLKIIAQKNGRLQMYCITIIKDFEKIGEFETNDFHLFDDINSMNDGDKMCWFDTPNEIKKHCINLMKN